MVCPWRAASDIVRERVSALCAPRQILFVDVSPPASMLGRSLCLDVPSFSAACSRASTGPPGIGGPRRRWSPRKGSWRRRLPPPCCRDRPCNFHVSMPRPPHLLFVRAPPYLPRTAVSVTGWPKFGMNCILSDVRGCSRSPIFFLGLCSASRGWRRCGASTRGWSTNCSQCYVLTTKGTIKIAHANSCKMRKPDHEEAQGLVRNFNL